MISLFFQTIPEDVSDRFNEIADAVKEDTTLQFILIGVGILTAVIFVFGIMRQAFKAALFAAAASVAVWIWYFNEA